MKKLLSQAVIIRDSMVLLVKQFVERGDIVWNFPGGGIEEWETPEAACIREVREETGYEAAIEKLLQESSGKYTYIAAIVGGNLSVDRSLEENSDIIEAAWIDVSDREKFDAYTLPVLKMLDCNEQGSSVYGQELPGRK